MVSLKSSTIISIVFRNQYLILTKSICNSRGLQIKSYHKVALINPCDYFLTLDKALSELPNNFFQNAKITLALPFSQQSIDRLKLPVLDKKELYLAIENQIQNVEQYNWNYLILNPQTKENKSQNDILITKVEQAIIENYVAIFTKHKITLNSLVPEVNVINNILNAIPKTNDDYQLLIDMDLENLKIYLLKNKTLCFLRTIHFGYKEILKPLCGKISLNNQEFEFDFLSAQDLLKKNDIFTSSKDNTLPLEHFFFLIRSNLEKISLEIQKSIQFFSEQIKEGVTFNSGLITGHFLNIKNISTFLSKELNLSIASLEFNNKLFVNNKIQDEDNDYLAFSVANSLCFPEPVNHALLPNYYVNQKTYGMIIFSTLTAIFLGFVLAFVFFINNTKEKMELTKTTSKLDQQITVLSKTKENNLNTANLNSKKINAIKFLQEIQKNNLDLANLLYYLNQIHFSDGFFTNLEIKENTLIIKGKIKKEKAQWLLTNYLNSLKNIIFLTNLELQIFKNNDSYLDFMITAKVIQPVDKKI